MRRAQSYSTGTFLTSLVLLFLLALVSQLPAAAGPRGFLKGALAPFTIAGTALYLQAQGGVAVVTEASHLRADRRRLADENASLRRQVAELQAAGAENQQLRDALKFQKGFGGAEVAASVIGRAPDGLNRTLTIDRGSADGLKVGMIVVSGAGLVGRVTETGPRTASVQTLLDAQSRVNAFSQNSGYEGTVMGEGGPLTMELLPHPGFKVNPGEWVLTSGVGGSYPRGIAIGQVARFHRQDSATLEIAEIAPANDFARLAMVLVILDFTPR